MINKEKLICENKEKVYEKLKEIRDDIARKLRINGMLFIGNFLFLIYNIVNNKSIWLILLNFIACLLTFKSSYDFLDVFKKFNKNWLHITYQVICCFVMTFYFFIAHEKQNNFIFGIGLFLCLCLINEIFVLKFIFSNVDNLLTKEQKENLEREFNFNE